MKKLILILFTILYALVLISCDSNIPRFNSVQYPFIVKEIKNPTVTGNYIEYWDESGEFDEFFYAPVGLFHIGDTLYVTNVKPRNHDQAINFKNNEKPKNNENNSN